MRKKRWLVLLASLAVVLLASSVGVTRSSFVDLESSIGNTFQAWTSTQWVQTTEDDFNAGVLNQVDTSSSSGDVKLATASEAIAFVKNIGTDQIKGAGTSISITVPAAGVKAGNSIIVTFAMDSFTGSVSVSDSKGNTYTLDADVGATGTADKARTLIFSAHNVTAQESGDTITVTHPSPNDWACRAVSAAEFSGLWMTSTLDKTSTATGTSTTPSSGSTTTTSQADELLIGAIGVEGPLTESFTAGSGYTALSRDGTSGAAAASNITINPEYRIVSATGTYEADGTLSSSRDWAAAIVTYKMLIGYVSSGTVASQVLDTGLAGARWDALFWDETVEGGTTDITFEVRSSDASFAKGDASPSWTSGGGTSPVTSGLPSGRCMQWRATLTTSDTSKTPTLHEVRVYHY